MLDRAEGIFIARVALSLAEVRDGTFDNSDCKYAAWKRIMTQQFFCCKAIIETVKRATIYTTVIAPLGVMVNCGDGVDNCGLIYFLSFRLH